MPPPISHASCTTWRRLWKFSRSIGADATQIGARTHSERGFSKEGKTTMTARPPAMMRIALSVLLMTAAVAVIVPASTEPAFASTCVMTYDCTAPDSQACQTNPDSTVRTKAIPGGTLELRYDSGCRTIWGRIPSTVSGWPDTFYSFRYGGSGGCPWGDTSGLGIAVSGGYRWTKQLNDASCAGYTTIYLYGSWYQTSPGY